MQLKKAFFFRERAIRQYRKFLASLPPAVRAKIIAAKMKKKKALMAMRAKHRYMMAKRRAMKKSAMRK